MIEIRHGYDPDAASVMYHAFYDAPGEDMSEPEQSFVERCKNVGAFLGLYDPEPVGAVIYDGPYIHAGIDRKARGKCRDALRESVEWGLARIPVVIARVHQDNTVTKRLVLALGFEQACRREGDFDIYVRQKWEE